jgi:hypothetical protein
MQQTHERNGGDMYENSTPNEGFARRRLPRRQIVVPVTVERRRANRREGVLGADGLRHFVLADVWRTNS